MECKLNFFVVYRVSFNSIPLLFNWISLVAIAQVLRAMESSVQPPFVNGRMDGKHSQDERRAYNRRSERETISTPPCTNDKHVL